MTLILIKSTAEKMQFEFESARDAREARSKWTSVSAKHVEH